MLKNLSVKTIFFSAAAFIFLSVGFILSPVQKISAQTPPPTAATPLPAPTINPNPQATPTLPGVVETPAANRKNFDQTMISLQRVVAEVLPSWFRDAERYLMEYFNVLVGILAGIVFLGSFFYFGYNNVLQNNSAFLKWLLPALFFCILIPFTGDLDGDGRFSDPIEYFRLFGQALAYGPRGVSIDQNPNPLPVLVEDQQRYYNEAYQKFVKGTFTVKVEDGDTPVNVPAPEGMEKRLSVLYQGGYSLKNIKETVDPNSWTMTTMFQMVNFSRSAMEVGIIFTLAVQGILGSALRILFPFCIVFAIDPYLRKQMLGNYLWWATAACIVLPLVTQVVTFFCYGVCNFVLYSQSAEPYHIYDASTMSIIQQNDPTLMIWFFTILSIICFLILIGSSSLAYAVTRMNLYQWLTGAVSSGFTMLTSVAMSYVTSAVGAALGQSLDIQRAGVTRDVSDLGTMNQYRGSKLRTKTDFDATQTLSAGEYFTGQTAAEQHLQVGRMGNSAAFVTGAGTTLVDLDEKRQRAFLGGAVGMSRADIDAIKQLDGLQAEQMQMAIEANPALKNIWAKTAETVPFLGPVAGGVINAGDNLTKGTLGNFYVGKDGLKAINEFGMDKNGKFSSELFAENMYAQMATTPEGLKALDKMGLSPEKIGRTTEGNGAFGFPQGGFAPNLGNGTSSFSGTGGKKMGGLNGWYMNTLNAEMTRRGYTPQARAVLLANFMRENGNPATAFDGHIDPAKDTARGIIRNSGIISWNGDRLDKMHDHLRGQGISVSKDGRIEQTPRAVRAMVGFMDQEMKGYGVRADMRNPSVGIDKLNRDMRTYIGFSDKPIYDNVGKNARNLQKVMPLIQANSGGGNLGEYVPSVRPNMSGNQNGANIPQVISRQGSYDLTVQPRQLPNPQAEKMYVNAQDSLNNMGKTKRDTMAPIYAKHLGIEARRDIVAQENLQTKQLLQAQTSSDIAISEQTAEGRLQVLEQQKIMQDSIADTNYNYETAQNQIRYASQMDAAGIRYDSGMQTAEWDKDTGLQQAEMRFNQDIIDAKARAGITIINSVGSSLAHQIEEAFEKLNNRY